MFLKSAGSAFLPSKDSLMKRRLLLWTLAISILRTGVSSGRAAAFEVAKFPAHPPVREMREEIDPTDQQACDSMGQISIRYESGNDGPPNVGLRITDPWGRKIGYDPRGAKAWQELPIAEGFVECDENGDVTGFHCAAHIQICGPVSGTYKVEVLPTQNVTYSISVLGTSQLARDQVGFRSTSSRTQYRSEIRKQSPEILQLTYSRELGVQIKLQGSDSQ
jgi:hypothetical protein